MPPFEHYVYYRVAQADLALAVQHVQRAQAAWRQAHPGNQARLLLRADEGATVATLMEIYRLTAEYTGPAAGVEAQGALETMEAFEDLAHLEQQLATELAPWLSSPRHLERFVPLAFSSDATEGHLRPPSAA